MSEVFISYSRLDSDIVEKIRQSLLKHDIQVWIDQTDIEFGERWDVQIESGIQSCEKILVVLSKASIDSENVGNEWSYALEKDKYIIPVQLEECEVPMRIANLQRVEFMNGFDEGIETLVNNILKDSTGKGKTSKKNTAGASSVFSGMIESVSEMVKSTRFVKSAKYTAIVGILALVSTLAYDRYSVTELEDLTGKTQEKAEAILGQEFLSVGRVYIQKNNEQDEGTVFKTEPSAGSQLKRLSNVDLYIVAPKPTSTGVKNLVGRTIEEAEVFLVDDYLSVGHIFVEPQRDAKEGTIFKTDPPAGEILNVDSKVDLYVAGKANKLPHVIGLTREKAEDELRSLGLHVKVVHTVSANRKDFQKVVSASLERGSPVFPGDEVTIVMAHKGGWIYLKKGKENQELTLRSAFNLRVDSFGSSKKIGIFKPGEVVKILQARSDGWRKVRAISQSVVEKEISSIEY